MAKPIRLAVMLSGGGTTLENICEHIDAGKLDEGSASRRGQSGRRSIRGGSYLDNRFNCQVSVRRAMQSDQGAPTVGFRPVLLLEVVR